MKLITNKDNLEKITKGDVKIDRKHRLVHSFYGDFITIDSIK